LTARASANGGYSVSVGVYDHKGISFAVSFRAGTLACVNFVTITAMRQTIAAKQIVGFMD